MAIKYRSKSPVHTDHDARVIGRFLSIRFPDGFFSAGDVLEAARPDDSPIHRFFNWDDSEAAERYRLIQARQLITCLVVDVDDYEVRKYTTPVRIEQVKNFVYCDIEKARADEDIWQQVIGRAMQDLILWQHRYQHLKALGLVHRAIAKTKQKLKIED